MPKTKLTESKRSPRTPKRRRPAPLRLKVDASGTLRPEAASRRHSGPPQLCWGGPEPSPRGKLGLSHNHSVALITCDDKHDVSHRQLRRLAYTHLPQASGVHARRQGKSGMAELQGVEADSTCALAKERHGYQWQSAIGNSGGNHRIRLGRRRGFIRRLHRS